MPDSLYARNLRVELQEIEDELKALRVNGQEYLVVGSHSRKGVPYFRLQRRRTEIINALASLNNGRPDVLPDFS